jgi:4-amino-4-deoxy-L-arabinose transferase-like glycosyltransferase
MGPGRVVRLAAAVAAIAVVARLGLALPRLGSAPDDPDNYLPLAASLAEGRGLSFGGRPTAYRPPLYPMLLAPLVAAFGEGPRLAAAAIALNAMLGGLAAALTIAAAIGLGLGAWPSALAGLIVALDPVLAAQARSVMTESLTAALLAAALAAACRGAPRLAGLALGLASLTRPSVLPAAALSIAAAAVLPPGSNRGRLARAGWIALGLIAPLIPWAARNALVLGEPIVTTTHGGYTLYLANNREYYSDVLDGPPGAVWTGPNQRRFFEQVNRIGAGLPEPAADRLFRDRALAFIAAHPAEFARAAGARLGRFWAVAPAPGVYPWPWRWACAAWTLPLWVLAAAGVARRGGLRWPRAMPIALVAGLTVVHAAYWTDLRMRAPIVPAIALLAARGVSRRPDPAVITGVTPG